MALSFSVFSKFRAVDGVTAPVRKMEKSVGKFGKTSTKEFKRADRAAGKFAANLKTMGQTLAISVSAPVALLGFGAVKMAIDFEEAFTGVMKTVEATSTEFDLLKKDLIDLSRTIPIATTEIFSIAEAAGQLGIKTKDIVNFTKVMADLGATTSLTSEEAATSLARLANIMHISSGDYSRLGSAIVGLGNNFEANETEIVGMSMGIAAAGNLVGMTVKDVLGFSTALTSIGMEAEAGGSAFSKVIMTINKEIGTGSDKMKLFAKTSGKSVKQFEKMWKKNATNAMMTFIEGLKKTKKDGGNVSVVLSDLSLNGIRVSKALLGAAEASGKFRDAISKSNVDWIENLALLKEANLRYGTLGSKVKILMNVVKILGASFGDVLTPVVSKFIDILIPITQRFEKLNTPLKVIIITFGVMLAVAGPLLILFGAIAASITAISAVGLPMIATIVAISGAVAIAITSVSLLIVFFDDLKNKVGEVVVAIIKSVGVLLSGIARVMGAIAEEIMGVITGPIESLAKVSDKVFGGIGRFAGGVIGKVMGEDQPQQPQNNQTPISPNTGMINTLRQETTNKSVVDVNLKNVPQGSTVKQSSDVDGFNLNMGFAGAT